jgi:phenylpropionate dioxygenase-like ring-hydroxylating dioxygenase large terminal subunit
MTEPVAPDHRRAQPGEAMDPGAVDPAESPAWDTIIPRRFSATGLEGRPSTAHAARAPDDSAYELVDRPSPPPVPNGWYTALGSAELAPGEVRSFIAVERHLVVFRDEAGAAHVLDAHCPHLGAHLGGGSVRGDSLACPYHGWRFDGDGRVVEIPYGDARIPSRACVRSYPVREQDGLVLFWSHARGVPPQYEVPPLAEASDPDWSDAHVYTAELVASLQDMAENNVDAVHFRFVHGRDAMDLSSSEVTTDGPFSVVVERFDDDGLVFTRWTYGPGVAVLRVPGLTTVLTTTTPIDRRHVRLRWHFHFPAGVESVADDVIEGVVGEHGLGADVPIWRDKVFRDRPVLVKGDGPFTEFRRWYEQFYDGCREGGGPT